jgi:small subunit ribosomal protein S17
MANNRKRLTGHVIRHSMQKTVVVEVESTKLHPLYKKVVRSRKSYMVHDETDSIPVGAIVKIVESRPISKTKHWAVEEVLQLPGQSEGLPVPDESEAK